MRKGLTVTLLTVAIAILGSNAMSMAPTISDMKGIVISDDEPVSGANHFVYDDVINLDSVVSDESADSALVWSYFESTGKYRVNNKDSMAGGDDPVAPPAAKIIAGPGATAPGDPDDGDSNLSTFTIRNDDLSPVAGPDVDPAGTGVIASETAALTFWVSDGDLASSETVMVFTEDDGVDHLSPAGGTNILTWDFSAGANSWVFATAGGTATSSQTTDGICINVPTTGDNQARWDSPYGNVQLVDNTVLEIRLHMTTNQTTASSIPLWDIIIQNSQINPAAGPSGAIGANSYGGDYWYLDNIGGSQGIGLPNGRSDFKIFFAPPALTLASWRSTTTGAFQPTADPFNDMAFNFRIFDIGSSGYNANNDSGTVCLQEMVVERWSFDAMTRGTSRYSDEDLQTGDWKNLQIGTGGNLTFANGDMTLSPSSGSAWSNSVDVMTPGVEAGSGLPKDAPTAWPIAWESDKILLMEVEASAPTAGDQANQPDILLPMIDAGGSETFQSGFQLLNIKFLGAGTAGAGAPPVGSTAKYVMFAFTNKASVASDFAFLRPRVDIQNFPSIQPQNPTGSIRIHGITVTEVTFGN